MITRNAATRTIRESRREVFLRSFKLVPDSGESRDYIDVWGAPQRTVQEFGLRASRSVRFFLPNRSVDAIAQLTIQPIDVFGDELHRDLQIG